MPLALTDLAPVDLPVDPSTLDIRLVAVDMDGTLLDDDHRVHPTFWPLLAELTRRGVRFCPASGRQHATLARQFADVADRLVFIAENGAYVVRQGIELSSQVMDRAAVDRVIRIVRELSASGTDIGVVVCGKRSAYIERSDAAFLAEARRYYARLETVDDLTRVQDDVLKAAVFDFHSARTTAPSLAELTATHQVVVSSEHWVDVMTRTTNKGAALRGLQQSLGVAPAQTVVFGDYLNDLEMLDAAELSFAMANAHPAVRERARHLAPGNQENGVVRTLAALLGLSMQDLAGAATSA